MTCLPAEGAQKVCPQFRNGLAVAGEDVVMALTYAPAYPSAVTLDDLMHCLSGALSTLSPDHRGRVIVDLDLKAPQHWLLLHIAPEGASAIPHMMAALEQRALLLAHLSAAGLSVQVASHEACRALTSHLPAPHLEDQRSVGGPRRAVLTLTQCQSSGAEANRELVEFFCSHNPATHLLLDFRNEPNGARRFDLSLILSSEFPLAPVTSPLPVEGRW